MLNVAVRLTNQRHPGTLVAGQLKLALVPPGGLRILRHARPVDPLGARESAADVRIDFCW